MFAWDVVTRQLEVPGRLETEHTAPSPTSTEPRRVGCEALLTKSDHQHKTPSGEHPRRDTLGGGGGTETHSHLDSACENWPAPTGEVGVYTSKLSAANLRGVDRVWVSGT